MELKDIYVITNTITNEQYVGQSKDSNKRFKQHLSEKDKLPLHQAIQIFGKENFILTILERQIENYNEREQYWIKKLNTLAPNGYNKAQGGNGYPHMNGINCYQSVFNDETLALVIKDLKYSDEPITHLAKKYSVNKSIIYGINYGWHYKNENYQYPIRPKKQKIDKKVNLLSKPEIQQELKKRLEYLQESTEALARDYGVLRGAIEQFNRGETHFHPEWDYPLRKIPYNPKILPKEKVQQAIDELLTTNKSLRQIARELDIGRCALNHINLGNSKYYYFKELSYPLRKIN